ncbi:hypothetical protein PHYSODRAFT_344107 [Phytophthora sojae]|uniref:Uncharacterized protein n=1 Tax=Phytophthora sojae (strain P6497) TaxID=1094619 RepID=G4YN50_PHYSP|nr:hypothetical protein PHYSODRAFT_344107 [Phytophthora sojae]EGZ29845.1 hypothetical protein PHYSODRAFT_344107 [Phytophthora sojae]|eukprot:XP_009517120.1 hypothetical protein PHYSODRAFT_344107 [Phytophthora sojae]
MLAHINQAHFKRIMAAMDLDHRLSDTSRATKEAEPESELSPEAERSYAESALSLECDDRSSRSSREAERSQVESELNLPSSYGAVAQDAELTEVPGEESLDLSPDSGTDDEVGGTGEYTHAVYQPGISLHWVRLLKIADTSSGSQRPPAAPRRHVPTWSRNIGQDQRFRADRQGRPGYDFGRVMATAADSKETKTGGEKSEASLRRSLRVAGLPAEVVPTDAEGEPAPSGEAASSAEPEVPPTTETAVPPPISPARKKSEEEQGGGASAQSSARVGESPSLREPAVSRELTPRRTSEATTTTSQPQGANPEPTAANLRSGQAEGGALSVLGSREMQLRAQGAAGTGTGPVQFSFTPGAGYFGALRGVPEGVEADSRALAQLAELSEVEMLAYGRTQFEMWMSVPAGVAHPVDVAYSPRHGGYDLWGFIRAAGATARHLMSVTRSPAARWLNVFHAERRRIPVVSDLKAVRVALRQMPPIACVALLQTMLHNADYEFLNQVPVWYTLSEVVGVPDSQIRFEIERIARFIGAELSVTSARSQTPACRMRVSSPKDMPAKEAPIHVGGQEHHRLGNDPAGAPRSQQAARVAVVTVEKVLLSQSTSQPTLLAKTNAYAQAGTAVDHAAVKTDEGYRTGPRGGEIPLKTLMQAPPPDRACRGVSACWTKLAPTLWSLWCGHVVLWDPRMAEFVGVEDGALHKRQVDKSLENRQPKLPDVEVGIPPRNTQGSNVQTVANMKSPLAKDDTCSGQVVHQAERYATVMKPKHPRQGGNCLDAALNM